MQTASTMPGTASTPPVADRARRKVYIHVVLPLLIASVLAYVDRINIGYASLTMNKDLGFDARVFGFGAGIFYAGYVIFEIPGALFAERRSPRVWVARIMVSWGLVCGLMAFMQTQTQFYIARFLLGAAEASLYPVIYATIIPRWFPAAERARAIAVLLTSLQIAGIIGAPLAGWLLGVPLFGMKGWQSLFIVEALPAILFGLVIPYWLADWPKDAKWLTEDERKHLQDQYQREVEAVTREKKYTVGQALRDREVLKLCAIYFFWITGFWGFNYWMPQVLKAASGWSNLAIGWLTAIPMACSLAFMLFIGHSSSKRNEKRRHGAVCLLLGAVGLGVGAFTHEPWLSFVFVTVAAIGCYGAFGVWWSYPTTFLSGAAAAGAIGLINSAGNVGGFVGPYITGWIKDTTGTFSTAWIYLSVSLVVAALLILTFKEPNARSGPPASS
jgi:MFS transporter, ACS family, tartrate transporter